MIKEIKGNLLDTDASIIIHGCNCQGVMNSGVAKAIRERYPEAYTAYKEASLRKGGLVLGLVVPAITHDGKKVLNAMTQEYYGRDGKQYVSYDAVRWCMHYIKCALEGVYETVAMPKIGCGLGGGDWNIIKDIIEEELKNFNVEVYYL